MWHETLRLFHLVGKLTPSRGGGAGHFYFEIDFSIPRYVLFKPYCTMLVLKLLLTICYTVFTHPVGMVFILPATSLALLLLLTASMLVASLLISITATAFPEYNDLESIWLPRTN